MIRTRVQLTENQMATLRHLASITGKSISEQIREGIDLYLAGRRAPKREDPVEQAMRVAGTFSSGLTDVSAEHDRHLAAAFSGCSPLGRSEVFPARHCILTGFAARGQFLARDHIRLGVR